VTRVSASPGVTFGTPALVPFGFEGNHTSGGVRTFDVLPDGRFVGLEAPSGTEEPDQADQSAAGIRYVINWFEELKRLVPTDGTNR
jgi:hypothetical protein